MNSYRFHRCLHDKKPVENIGVAKTRVRVTQRVRVRVRVRVGVRVRVTVKKAYCH